MRRSRRPLLLASLAAATVLVPTAAVAAHATPPARRAEAPRVVPASDWPTYHHDQGRTADGLIHGTFTSLHPSVTWHLPMQTASQRADQIYASPLVVGSTAFVTTLENRVYAISLATGRVGWSRTLGAAYTPPAGVCGDIRPTVGVVGTPVIDEGRHELYVVADVGTGAGGRSPLHRLFGLSTSTGTVLLDRVVDPPHQQNVYLLERVSLALTKGRVVFGMGGNDGDCGTYHGWVLSVPEYGAGAIDRYEVANQPGDGKGAVWMGGGAPVVDRSGNVYVSDGNGDNTAPTDPFDDSDAVLKLTPTMHLLDYFAPTTWYSDNASDLDLGSGQPELLPNGDVVQVGKTHLAYVLPSSNLGHVNAAVATFPICVGMGADHGGDAMVGGTVVFACGGGLDAAHYSATPPYGTELWSQPIASGPPVYAAGLVWSIQGSHGPTGTSTLYALSPASGAVVLHDAFGAEQNHFPTPAVGDNRIVVASTTAVLAFSPA
jgi:polyvinyl alcohol dehydrogenase (cytochrome)